MTIELGKKYLFRQFDKDLRPYPEFYNLRATVRKINSEGLILEHEYDNARYSWNKKYLEVIREIDS